MNARPKSPTSPPAAVEVEPSDLHGSGTVFCPNPKMTLWSNHPRVFLEVGTTGQGKCPYCGTIYRLAGGARASGVH